MQITSLEYFVDIADTGSYYQAEKVSGKISAQAYSKAVKSLEQELGVKLVKTSRRGVELTADGAVFLEFARSTLDGFARMQAKLSGVNHPAEPKRPVVFTTFYAASVLSELMPLGYIPSDIQIREEPFQDLVNRCSSLHENEIALVDLQDGGSSIDLKRNNLSFKSLAECRPMAVVTGDSALAQLGRNLEISDLRNARILCNSHPEMMHRHRKLLELLPGKTSVSGFSYVKGLPEYLRMNPDLVFLGDTIQDMLASAMDRKGLQGFAFIPINTNLASTRLGILRRAGEKKSREANALIRTIAEAFGRLAEDASEL